MKQRMQNKMQNKRNSVGTDPGSEESGTVIGKTYAPFAWVYNGLSVLISVFFVLGVFGLIPGAGSLLPSDGRIRHVLIAYPWLFLALRILIYLCLLFGYTYLALPLQRRDKDRILKRLPPNIWLAFAAEIVFLLGGFLRYPLITLAGLILLTIFRYRLCEQVSVFDRDPAQLSLAWAYGLDTGWLITASMSQIFAVVIDAGVTLSETMMSWIAVILTVLILVPTFFGTRRSRSAALPVGTTLGYLMIIVRAFLTGASAFLIIGLILSAGFAGLLAIVCYIGNGRKLTARPLHTRY